MNEDRLKGNKGPAARRYAAPRLVIYGGLAALTASGSTIVTTEGTGIGNKIKKP